MASDLSPQSENYIREAIAGGVFPSRESVLEAAIAALREKQADLPFIPDEHMALVEAAIEDAEANGAVELTDEVWDRIEREALERARQPRR